MAQAATTLRIIKAIHTVVWAMFAGAIVAIPILAWREQWLGAALLIALVLIECLVLVVNRMQCPLTGVAERYTSDRRANFDIYLPERLARYNKVIFGSLFAVGVLFTVVRWWL